MELYVVSRKSVVKNDLPIIEINTANTHFRGHGGTDLWSPFNLFTDPICPLILIHLQRESLILRRLFMECLRT